MGNISEAAKKMAPIALSLHLAYLPSAQRMYEQACEFNELVLISGRNVDEVKEKLGAYSGSLRALKAFYMMHGCFPSEFEIDGPVGDRILELRDPPGAGSHLGPS